MQVDLSQMASSSLLMAELAHGYNASKDGVGNGSKKHYVSVPYAEPAAKS